MTTSTEQRQGDLVTVWRRDDDVVVRVLGEIDLATVHDVAGVLIEAGQDVPRVILDLSQAPFMDSSAVHLCIDTASALASRGSELWVVEPKAEFRQIFSVLDGDQGIRWTSLE